MATGKNNKNKAKRRSAPVPESKIEADLDLEQESSSTIEHHQSAADYRSFFPSRALEMGRLYKMSSDRREDPLLRRQAREVLEEFRGIVKSFPRGTKEQAYMVNFHHSALDYAGSIRRIDRELDDELRESRREWNGAQKGILSTVKNGTLFRVAAKYLVIGGLFFFLATAVKDKKQSSVIAVKESPMERLADEFAAGMGSIVLAYLGQGLLLSYRLGKVRKKYEIRVGDARTKWAHSHVEIHNMSLSTVEQEWKDLTQADPPLCDLARLQIRAVYMGAMSERSQINDDSFAKKLAKRWRTFRAIVPLRQAAAEQPDATQAVSSAIPSPKAWDPNQSSSKSKADQ